MEKDAVCPVQKSVIKGIICLDPFSIRNFTVSFGLFDSLILCVAYFVRPASFFVFPFFVFVAGLVSAFVCNDTCR